MPDVGVTVRHSRSCPKSRGGQRCRCTPTFQAQVWSTRENRRITKTFPTKDAASSWRSDAKRSLRRRSFSSAGGQTIAAAAKDWVAGARSGQVRNRSGRPYKPSSVRSYEQTLNTHVVPDYGSVPVRDLVRADVQALADRMLEDGLDPSTVRNTINSVRVLYRRALRRGDVDHNPTLGLELPAVEGRRERFATLEETHRLIAALDAEDQALYATALYAGPRRGELLALDVADVNVDRWEVSIHRSWDIIEGPVEAKSIAGRRKLPVPVVLRPHLVAQLDRRPSGLLFGRGPDRPFNPRSVGLRADRAWTRANERGAELPEADRPTPLEPITLHECRHTYASLMIEAMVRANRFNPKALQYLLGHASITVTMDRYGHLMPGSYTEAAGHLDDYVASLDAATRGL